MDTRKLTELLRATIDPVQRQIAEEQLTTVKTFYWNKNGVEKKNCIQWKPCAFGEFIIYPMNKMKSIDVNCVKIFEKRFFAIFLYFWLIDF